MNDREVTMVLLRNALEAEVTREAGNGFAQRLRALQVELEAQFPSRWAPVELKDAFNRMQALVPVLGPPEAGAKWSQCPVSMADLPLLRLALEEHVERLIVMQEETARLSHLDEPQVDLAARIEAVQAVLSRTPLALVDELPEFTASRYLNLETATRFNQGAASLEPRRFDDKFRILTSQSLFLPDVRYFRTECILRKRPISVAYIDIDNFGAFNRGLSGKETQVDRDVLPRFMAALEAYVFGRGHAYREGGDEYLVLLPNSSHCEAAGFFEGLRLHLAAVTYPIAIAGPTVSIGVCTADPSERLTPRQMQSHANVAKAFAKEQGRNRVAGYSQGAPRAADTLIILPEPAAS